MARSVDDFKTPVGRGRRVDVRLTEVVHSFLDDEKRPLQIAPLQ